STTGNPGPFQVGLYRSTDGITYNPADLIPGMQKTIIPNPNGGEGTDTFTLPPSFSGTPDYPYLLVVADPSNAIAESDEDNNSKFILLPKSDIEVLSVKTDDSQSITVDYRINDAAIGQPIRFNVYASQ